MPPSRESDIESCPEAQQPILVDELDAIALLCLISLEPAGERLLEALARRVPEDGV
jgi:hypothetical protein